MNVVYVGNVGPAAHATYTTENHVAKSLAALGHTVIPVMEGADCGIEVRRQLRAQSVDLVLYTRTDGLRWDHGDAIDCWDICRGRGIPTASLHLDAFFGLDRRGVKVDVGNALFAVDYVFTADGDHQPDFADRGINHHWLPPGVLFEECGPGTPQAQWAADVAWVGSSRGYHREWPRRPQLVAALEQSYAGRLTRAGDGVTVREQQLNDLYASTKVSAGDSLAPKREASRYWSDRVPEAAGRGSVLVHPTIDAAVDLFGDSVVWCGWDIGDQLAAIDDVLTWTPTKRAAHIAAAVAHVRREHTYRNRCRTMLHTIGL